MQKQVTDLLKVENDNLNERLVALEIIVDNNEQHDRNINLLLHGVPELTGEKTSEEFVKALAPYIDVKVVDISRSHRLGPPKPSRNKPRPIIARFREENTKMDIFRKKSALRGVKLLLTENLTKWRQSLFTSAKNVLGVRKVWTNEGRIFTKVNDRIREIRSVSDIPTN